jgi:hypothetical protein
MALEITGSLITKLQVQSGSSTRGEWQKQEFVIETQETYPRKVCMNVWGADKVSELASFREGDLLKISFNIESREYNQRWYTDIRAWRIEKADKEGSTTERDSRNNQGNSSATPGSLQSDIPSDLGEDDLPF